MNISGNKSASCSEAELPEVFSFVSTDKAGAFAQTVKKSGTGTGISCDMLENIENELAAESAQMSASLSAYEIQTIHVVLD